MSIFANVLEAWRVRQADKLFPPAHPVAALVARMADQPDPWLNEVPAVVHDKLTRKAVEVAETQLGLAEDGHNGGPNVARWVAPARCPQNYCGGGIGWSYQEAASLMGIPLPFKRSLGAKRLGRNVAEVGRLVMDWRQLTAGDLLILDRGPAGSWQGHATLVTGQFDRGVHTIEWNHGPVVERFARYPDNPKERFAFGASLRRG